MDNASTNSVPYITAHLSCLFTIDSLQKTQRKVIQYHIHSFKHSRTSGIHLGIHLAIGFSLPPPSKHYAHFTWKCASLLWTTCGAQKALTRTILPVTSLPPPQFGRRWERLTPTFHKFISQPSMCHTPVPLLFRPFVAAFTSQFCPTLRTVLRACPHSLPVHDIAYCRDASVAMQQLRS